MYAFVNHPMASSTICIENVSAPSFTQYLLSIYFLPGAVPGIWATSENETDSPPKCLILATADEQSIINIISM